jgi:hypothetical protein
MHRIGVFYILFFTSIFYFGLGLAEGGGLEAESFNLAQMLIRSTNVERSTSAPLLANPC